jgi:hypothetical protein
VAEVLPRVQKQQTSPVHCRFRRTDILLQTVSDKIGNPIHLLPTQLMWTPS